MTGYETFALYNSLKLHFSKESFDFFKYGGKSKISVNAFENRKDKWHFYKISRKYIKREELISFLVANFLENENVWAGELLEGKCHRIYLNRQKVIQSLTYTFKNDCLNLFEGTDNPNEVINTTGDYPILLKRALQKEVEIETICILNSMLKFFPMWNRKISDTIRWPDYHRKICKYAPFVKFNDVKCKMILKEVINKQDEKLKDTI